MARIAPRRKPFAHGAIESRGASRHGGDMCILALAFHAHPRWPIVVVANRDERHDRASAKLARWEDVPGLIAGRDLVSGGSWLGAFEGGRLCAVTNRRGYGAPDPKAPSRGGLVVRVLQGESVPLPELERYNPVSVLAIGARRAGITTNRPGLAAMPLEPGVHGLANGPLNEAAPKVIELKAALGAWLAQDQTDRDILIAALRSETAAMETGAPGDGVFVRNPVYGTRCSTVVTVDANGAGMIHERRFDENGRAKGDTAVPFRFPLG